MGEKSRIYSLKLLRTLRIEYDLTTYFGPEGCGLCSREDGGRIHQDFQAINWALQNAQQGLVPREHRFVFLSAEKC